ncbi:MAG: hypothetical protein ACRCY7_02815 [Cetobacterium sp.]|uniref:hypothetical protein n=1 Tax=Cetobacterium sp. TaxID=2071632 RepID=UPI003F3E9035
MKVFIAGAIKIKDLKKIVIEKLDGIIEKNFEVLVGDADGIDSSVQKYFKSKNYGNIKIYCTNGVIRNNFGDWEVISAFAKDNERGRAFYTVKDKKMAHDADIGFMIWNGESEGTLNNIINLLKAGKRVCLFLDNENKLLLLKEFKDLEKVIILSNSKTQLLYKKLLKKYNFENKLEDDQMRLI